MKESNPNPNPNPNSNQVPDYLPFDLPRFAVGEVVRHRQYGYRGVVVDFDMLCQADEQWYQHNRTRPRREQPWYHVLVHGSDLTTYAAEENLLPDDSGGIIIHPLLKLFFESPPRKGRYVRNDQHWPGWDEQA